VAESEEFFQEYSGSISHTEASCMKFSARLNDNSPPAFTKDFKDIIREMDSLTEELWDSNIETKKLDDGKLISRKNEKNEMKFDALFQKFIENFGTHYIQKAVMGGIQRLSSAIKSLKEDEGNVEQVENCLNKAIKEKRKDKSVQDGTTNDNCNNEDIERRVKSALETTEVEVNTFGAGASEDIYQWTTNSFDNPTLLPNFKLQPIVKLFQPNFMNSKRVTRTDGTAINYKRILSWLMPRYAILVGRCKLMKNHRVSEGKTCLPNKEFLVSTRDGNDVTHLAALCRSLPDHLLEDGATDCSWCPGGVDHTTRTCKVKLDYLKLYQNEDWKKKYLSASNKLQEVRHETQELRVLIQKQKKILVKELGSEDVIEKALAQADDPSAQSWKGRAAHVAQLQRQVKELKEAMRVSRGKEEEDAVAGASRANKGGRLETGGEKETKAITQAAEKRREEFDRLQEEVERLRVEQADARTKRDPLKSRSGLLESQLRELKSHVQTMLLKSENDDALVECLRAELGRTGANPVPPSRLDSSENLQQQVVDLRAELHKQNQLVHKLRQKSVTSIVENGSSRLGPKSAETGIDEKDLIERIRFLEAENVKKSEYVRLLTERQGDNGFSSRPPSTDSVPRRGDDFRNRHTEVAA